MQPHPFGETSSTLGPCRSRYSFASVHPLPPSNSFFPAEEINTLQNADRLISAAAHQQQNNPFRAHGDSNSITQVPTYFTGYIANPSVIRRELPPLTPITQGWRRCGDRSHSQAVKCEPLENRFNMENITMAGAGSSTEGVGFGTEVDLLMKAIQAKSQSQTAKQPAPSPLGLGFVVCIPTISPRFTHASHLLEKLLWFPNHSSGTCLRYIVSYYQDQRKEAVCVHN
jgi:hypothetical protein